MCSAFHCDRFGAALPPFLSVSLAPAALFPSRVLPLTLLPARPAIFPYHHSPHILLPKPPPSLPLAAPQPQGVAGVVAASQGWPRCYAVRGAVSAGPTETSSARSATHPFPYPFPRWC